MEYVGLLGFKGHLSADEVIICETPRFCLLQGPRWVPEDMVFQELHLSQSLPPPLSPAVIVSSYQLQVVHHVDVLLVVAPRHTTVPRPRYCLHKSMDAKADASVGILLNHMNQYLVVLAVPLYSDPLPW